MLNISPSKLDVFLAIGIVVLLIFIIYNHRKLISTDKGDSARLGVQELIEKVKAELIATEQKRIEANEEPLFNLKDFDLEINFVVKESSTQKGGFEFKVVTVGSESGVNSEKTQKITLRMTAAQPQEQEEDSPALDDPAEILASPSPKDIKK